MGFFFTMLYLITAYLAPTTLFGDLAQYHIEVLFAFLAIVLAVFTSSGTNVLGLKQTWAAVGLCAAVTLSIVTNGWLGGGAKKLIEFSPNVVSFFLVYMTCRKKWHLQMLTAMLFFVAVFVVFQAEVAIHDQVFWSPYLLEQTVNYETGASIYRIRGLSFLGDPNDLAQFLVALIPCLFFSWKKDGGGSNFVKVYLPSAFLVWGMYLTHSRGGMVALMAMAIVAGRRKVGVVPSLLLGVLAFGALTAVGFAGGRDVSAGAGEDRMGAWSAGLEMVKAHPVLGVGYSMFSEYYEITAHNTFVVCAAELGLFGVFCWVLFVLVTVRNSYETSKSPEDLAEQEAKQLSKDELDYPYRRPAAAAVAVGGGGSHQVAMDTLTAWERPPLYAAPMGSASPYGFEEIEEDPAAADAEIRRLSGLMVVSFAGFLAAGWFLSRAYTICLYVNAGMAAAIYNMARERGIAAPEMPNGRALKLAAGTTAGVLAAVYLILRFDHLLPK